MESMEQFTGTKPMAASHAIDVAALERHLQASMPGFAGPLTVEQFKGGQSNPTYRLLTPAAQADGVRAALRDGSERFKLSTAELVELHAYAQAMTASADTQPPHACPPPAPASAYTGSLWALAH